MRHGRTEKYIVGENLCMWGRGRGYALTWVRMVIRIGMVGMVVVYDELVLQCL